MSDEGMESVLAQFNRFAGGVTVTPPATVDAPATITYAATPINAPLINGQRVGEWAEDGWFVDIRQVELAPSEDLVNSRYTPSADPDFAHLKEALAALGDAYDPLPARPAGRALAGGAPILLIADMPHVYYALHGLHRTRIKVTLHTPDQSGDVLLRSLTRHNALSRPPSIIEECEAVVRLTDHYRLSDLEIATQLAVNAEDHAAPSPQQVHYMRLVGKLHPDVKDMVYRKQIHWSHAKYIAEAYGQDDGLCVKLARLAGQGHTLTVDQLRHVIKRLQERKSKLIEEDGIVIEQRLDLAIHLVSDRSPDTIAPYSAMFGARPSDIRKRLDRYHPTITVAEKPIDSTVAQASFQPLVDFFTQARGEMRIVEVEAEIQAVMIALRQAAQAVGVVNADGVIVPRLEAIPKKQPMTS